jgi:hypothetical protein
VVRTVIIGQILLLGKAQLAVEIYSLLVFGMDFQKYAFRSVYSKRMEDMISQFLPDALPLLIRVYGHSIEASGGIALMITPQ